MSCSHGFFALTCNLRIRTTVPYTSLILLLLSSIVFAIASLTLLHSLLTRDDHVEFPGTPNSGEESSGGTAFLFAAPLLVAVLVVSFSSTRFFGQHEHHSHWIHWAWKHGTAHGAESVQRVIRVGL